MRVLITCIPGFGHLHPLLPLASALAGAGHEVAMATGPELESRVEAAGFPAFRAGVSLSEAFQQLAARYPDGVYNTLAPAEIMQWWLPHLFGEIAAPSMLGDLRAVARSWHPDVIVHDTFEFSGPVVAASAGVPSICHTLGPRFEGELLELIAAAVAPLWHQSGLEPDPSAGLYRQVCLDITPPSLQSAESSPFTDVIRPIRPMPAPAIDGERLPEWVHGRRKHRDPLVYMTLGTNTNSDLSMFRSVLDGLADLDADVLVTIGAGNDPAAIGVVPSNAHLEQYVPQSLLLQECAVVICHGGAGTTLGALANGLPLLALPQGADQYIISERLVASGAGLCLVPAEVNPDSVRTNVLALLDGTGHRAAARRVQCEIAAMPAPDQAVRLIEHVAATESPHRREPAGVGSHRVAGVPTNTTFSLLGTSAPVAAPQKRC